MPLYPSHYGLVIGINHYPKFSSLKGAHEDAVDFHQWLVNPDAGGVHPENTALILSKENPAKPLQDEIDDELEKLLIKARSEGPRDRLYLYFSGHGLGRTNLGADLCLAGWSKFRRAMALDSLGYLQMLMSSGCFREVIFFLDCCRIREIRANALPPTLEFPGPGDGAPKTRSFIGYATEFMNAAYEAETGLLDQPSNVRGHFTRALIQALNGAAADAGGGVRASKLKEYLEVNTPLIAKKHDHIQKPEVVNGLDGTSDPLFGHALPPQPPHDFAVHVTFTSMTAGEIVAENGQLEVLKRGDASTGPWRIPIRGPNVLMIRHVGTDTQKSFRIGAEATEDLHVEF